eukprot:UN2560
MLLLRHGCLISHRTVRRSHKTTTWLHRLEDHWCPSRSGPCSTRTATSKGNRPGTCRCCRLRSSKVMLGSPGGASTAEFCGYRKKGVEMRCSAPVLPARVMSA